MGLFRFTINFLCVMLYFVIATIYINLENNLTNMYVKEESKVT